MALNDLGKVAVTFGGSYNATTNYERLTIVVGSDGQTYGTITNNVIGIEPGVTDNWENYWQIVSMRGPQGNGIAQIAKTATSGTVDTYTITYDDGTASTFTVTNGEGIQSIVKTSTSGNIDTYTITFGNNQTATFTVTNARELAAGGTTGQMLVKTSDDDYAVSWVGAVDNLNTQNANLVLSANQGYQLNQKKAEASAVSVSLPASGWTALNDETYAQTINVSGVTASSTTNFLVVSPFHTSMSMYAECGIVATTQGNGTLAFNASAIPENDLTVNILIINKSGVSV